MVKSNGPKGDGEGRRTQPICLTICSHSSFHGTQRHSSFSGPSCPQFLPSLSSVTFRPSHYPFTGLPLSTRLRNHLLLFLTKPSSFTPLYELLPTLQTVTIVLIYLFHSEPFLSLALLSRSLYCVSFLNQLWVGRRWDKKTFEF